MDLIPTDYFDSLKAKYESDKNLVDYWVGEEAELKSITAKVCEHISFNYQLVKPLGVGGSGIRASSLLGVGDHIYRGTSDSGRPLGRASTPEWTGLRLQLFTGDTCKTRVHLLAKPFRLRAHPMMPGFTLMEKCP